MTIGYCYVVGDILHKGHIEYFRNCKAMCDKLVCGVLTDKAVMEKKPKPVLSFSERFDIIRSCKYVNVVVCQDEYSPLKNVNAIGVDILFESTSHSYAVKGIGDLRVITWPYYLDQSSTKIKEKIVGNKDKKPE